MEAPQDVRYEIMFFHDKGIHSQYYLFALRLHIRTVFGKKDISQESLVSWRHRKMFYFCI